MTGRKSGPGTEARMPGRAPRPVSGERAEGDVLGPRCGAVGARSPKPAKPEVTTHERAPRTGRSWWTTASVSGGLAPSLRTTCSRDATTACSYAP